MLAIGIDIGGLRLRTGARGRVTRPRRHGRHLVVVAGDGRQALEALGRESFDLVLMDVQMPEMGGLEATAVIREQERLTGGRLPIIAMTAHAMSEDQDRCLTAGMDGYRAKPLHKVELLAAIRRIKPVPIAISRLR
jgi:CheY-like chemotaxis protein